MLELSFLFTKEKEYNAVKENRMLIVLQAPSIKDSYYSEHFNKIIKFYIHFAKAILNKDNVIVLADKDTLPYLEKELPKEILLESNIEDIWIRDFAAVFPSKMLLFNYDRPNEPHIQKSFRDFIHRYNLKFKTIDLKLDGGNLVDNNKNAIILTEKILDRNPDYSKKEIIEKLKEIFNIDFVSIIPMDDEYLGHSDGMVMFLNEKSVLVNSYDEDPDLYRSVKNRLTSDIPQIEIVTVKGEGYGGKYGNYASACGIYVNSIVTNNYIYIPIFGNSKTDKDAIKLIRENTDKTVVPIDAKSICFLGGSLRCLSWQLTGENAKKLIEAGLKK